MESAQQAPHALLMIRPGAFGSNPQTAATNAFQQPVSVNKVVHQEALAEFDRMVDILTSNEIDVRVFNDLPAIANPDVVFPNNWITFHSDGRVIMYPMMAENRRSERRKDIIETLAQEFFVKEVVDLSVKENENQFLEGTGSLVLDYTDSIAYACRSPRTSEALVHHWCNMMDFKPVVFDAVDKNGIAVYHTNVMMCVGEKFAVVCLDAIHADDDQERLLASFEQTDHRVVAISYAQMESFAGNMIEVLNRNNEPHVLMSQQAYSSLLSGQLDAISRHAEILIIPISTIEKYGGGSVRCMVAGIYLPEIKSLHQ